MSVYNMSTTRISDQTLLEFFDETRLQTEKSVRKMKAKAFYSHLKEKKDGLLTASFNCQKNQVLPKLSDQAAYYQRQLRVYNLGIVVGDSGDSKDRQNRENVFLYNWNERNRKRIIMRLRRLFVIFSYIF